MGQYGQKEEMKVFEIKKNNLSNGIGADSN